MSTNLLILGESGTGKSTSLRNVDPKTSFLIKVFDKPLPFPKSNNMFLPVTKKGAGNLLVTDDAIQIINGMKWINESRPDVTLLIIDDYQYVMANEFMRKHSSTGGGNAVFGLYNSIGDKTWNVFMYSTKLRKDLIVAFLSHSERTDTGKTKCKTIGKMLDEKVTVEGMFTTVLETVVEDKNYYFLTNNNGNNTAKSPMGMFESEKIDNDLNFVVTKIKEYYNDTVGQ